MGGQAFSARGALIVDGPGGMTAATWARKTRAWALLLVVTMIATAIPVFAGMLTTARAASPAVAGTLDAAGFPIWAQDAVGTRVEPCIDAADTHCVLVANPGIFDPAQPLSFTTNYPDEFFYTVVDSVPVPTPGCPGAADPLAANPGEAFVRLAVEGAFLNGAPAPGDQMLFARTRVIVRGGLCPGQSYTFTHPYGSVTLTANDAGGLLKRDGTVDVGCVPAPLSPCVFTQALTAVPFTQGLLRWDPAVEPAADPGYLGGDPAVPHAITGGITNTFTVTDDATGSVVGTTDQFLVSGKLAGPIHPAQATTDFGGVDVGSAGAAQPVTLFNVSSNPLTITGIALGGTDLGSFVVESDDCTLAPVPVDGSCTVNVHFAPTAEHLRQATLDVTHDGFRSPTSVALQGTGLADAAPSSLSAGPAALDFGHARLRTLAGGQTITVTNTGGTPARISSVDLLASGTTDPAPDAAAFPVTLDACTATVVPAGGTCTVAFDFAPSEVRDYAADVRISSDAPGAAPVVALTGTGTGGVAAVSPTIDAVDGYPDWYQDESGMRVGQCVDAADPLCIVLPDAGYAGGPVVFPTNFPTEFFYYVADSDQIATPGCGDSAPGRAFIRMADEGSFTTPVVTPGEQIVFGRIRIVVTSGLCPDTTYTFTHPYGSTQVTTDASGGVRRNAATTDIGCLTAGCDFSSVIASPVLAGFLQQDGAPAGYLGNPNLLTTVHGAPYTPPGSATPANYFEITETATGTVIGHVDLFTVMGKLAGPMTVSPAKSDVGTLPVGESTADGDGSGPALITFTNDGIADVTVADVLLQGPAEPDYMITGGTCATGPVLHPASSGSDPSSCTVQVDFFPTVTGTRDATVVLVHDGANNPISASLTGIGAAPLGDAAISTSVSSVAFPDTNVAETSASYTITVSNLGGTAPLKVGDLAGGDPVGLTGPGAADFQFTNGCVTAVPIDGSCTIQVRFAPHVGTDTAADLTIPSNAPSGAVVVALAGRGFAGAPAVAATVTNDGFPSWFGDNNGTRLEPCLPASDPNCVVLADPGFNPALPMVFPSNYPAEFFYALADSDLVTIPADPACGGAGGTALLRLATEGSFANGFPEAGSQITFNRLRVTAKGLCPNTTYQFVTPYGAPSLTSDGSGAIKAKAGTVDLTDVTGTRPVAQGVLRWDPMASPPAPAGYLGDAVTFHTVVGGTYRPGGPGTEPVNSFQVIGPSGLVGQTDRFLVSGKMAGPVLASATAFDFGNVTMGTQSAVQTLTVTNVDRTSISGITPTLTGPNAAAFRVTGAGTCTAALVLAQDQSCTVVVRFDPAAAVDGGTTGNRTANLVVAHDGLRSPITVALRGTAIAPAIPAISVTPASLTFGNQDVATTSAGQNVTIRNTGNGNLTLGAMSLAGTGATSFQFLNGCAAIIAPGNSCVVVVQLRPTSTGAKAASLVVPSNDPVNPSKSVSLTGNGVAPTVAVSPTSLTFSTKGTSSQTVKLTNTGTSNLNLVGAPAITLVAVSGVNPTSKFTASNQNCNNVAPGKNCSISVTFAPGAGASNEVFQVALVVSTNATNPVVTISLTGTRK